MNCKTARQLIQLHLDDELSGDGRTTLAEHTSACDACRRFQRQLSEIRSAMHQLAESTQSEDAPLTPFDVGHPTVIPWRSIMATAAVLALCVGGYLATRLLQPKPTAAPAIVQQDTPAPVMVATDPRVPIIDQPPQRPPVRITVSAERDVITVPHKTENPNVTILWIYETVKTADVSPDHSDEPPSSS